MAFTVEPFYNTQYSLTEKAFTNNTHGFKLTNGNQDGFGNTILRTEGRLDNNLRAGAGCDIGGQIPFTKTGCHNWYTTCGLNIFGTLSGDINCKKTKDTGTANDGFHEYNIFAGGGIEVAGRGSYVDGAIGFKAGYEYNNVLSAEKNILKEHGNGRVVYGPTIRAQFYIPETGMSNPPKSGLYVGAGLEYNIPDKSFGVNVRLGYTFPPNM